MTNPARSVPISTPAVRSRRTSLTEAIHRLLSLAPAKAREAGIIAENAVLALVDVVMSFAVEMPKSGKRL